jgi:hypothetical protein
VVRQALQPAGRAGRSLFAGQYRLNIRPETAEGVSIMLIRSTTDDALKLADPQFFSTGHPKHEAIPWIWAQIQAIHTRAKNWDKVLESGERAVAAGPENMEAAPNCLKAAEAKNDAALIRKWSVTALENGRKAAAQPPSD